MENKNGGLTRKGLSGLESGAITVHRYGEHDTSGLTDTLCEFRSGVSGKVL